MKKSVLIISPFFPPERGGLADHTQRLAQELAPRYEVTILTSPGAGQMNDVLVHAAIGNWQDGESILRIIEGLPCRGPVIWQYVPHMYGRGGVNLALPKVMGALAGQQRRQWVIAHEVAAPISLWPHRFCYSLAHRWQWSQLLRWVDRIGLSTEAWLEQWRSRAPHCQGKFALLPSPSNIPVVPVSANHGDLWRQARGLPAKIPLLAYFGRAASSRAKKWVTAAWRQVQAPMRPVALTTIGDRFNAALPAEASSLFRPLDFLPAEEVSAALQAADLLLLPFVDGVSERRTTFMSGLNHQRAILTSIGPNTGATLQQSRAFESVQVGDLAAFCLKCIRLLNSPDRRLGLGRDAGEVYARLYDWPVVIRALQEDLGLD